MKPIYLCLYVIIYSAPRKRSDILYNCKYILYITGPGDPQGVREEGDVGFGNHNPTL